MKKNIKGYTLIEILVVITIFVSLSVLVTQSLLLSIKSTRKSMAITKVRENLSTAVGLMERNLRNARSVTSCASNTIVYVDADNEESSFSCDLGGDLLWGGNNITSSDVDLTTCTISCSPLESPPVNVTVNLTGESTASSGVEGEIVSVSAKVTLRNE